MQVPYQPFSTAEPSGGGERVSVATPPAAFGENIANAVQGLGSSTEQVGGEIFSRALALQDLRNETDAREAQTKYAEQASMLHAQYGALEGQAAADGLKDYIKAQGDLRQSIRGELNTAFAQRYYDRDTLPFMQRNIFSAAGHAADENKRSVVGTAQALKDVASKTFADPKSDEEFGHKSRQTNEADDTIAAAKGLTLAQTADLKMQSQSKLWLGRITQLSLNDPQAGLTMLDKVQSTLTQDDYKSALVVARAQNRAVGTENLINSVYSPDKSAKDMENEVIKASPALAHDDPLFEKDAVARLKSKIINERFVAKQDENAAYQRVMEAVQGGVANLRELRLQPGMAATIDSLPPNLQNKIPGMFTARDKQANDDRFTELWGQSYADREKFLDVDIMHEGISDAQKNRLITRRAAVLKDPNDDPHLSRVLGWMKITSPAELKALGVFDKPDKGEDNPTYDHYVGALQSAIDAWRQDNGKPPSYKDVTETIGPSVIKQRSEPGIFGTLFGGNKRAAFDQDMSVAREWAEKKGLVQQILDKGGTEPTDEEIYRAFIRSQFIDLYAKGKSSGGPAAPGTK